MASGTCFHQSRLVLLMHGKPGGAELLRDGGFRKSHGHGSRKGLGPLVYGVPCVDWSRKGV